MGKKLTLGSLFDGIGGWLVSAKDNGIEPVWASEIDSFPAAVSHHHFPDVKQLGDITKIKVDELEPVDIICAGSPCQDLSVAGKRAGLEGERSGLFRTAIRLVHKLRARTGKPRFFVWENVPGAFSSNKGHDFRAVLEEISQTEIPMPEGGKWAESGMVEWDGGSLAWRTLDAQYLGVPQRRKRIFLVADFGGQSAGEVLFERKSLHGHIEESEGERQGTATDAGTGTESTGWAVTLTMRAGKPGGGKGPLVKEEMSLALSAQNTQTVFENVNIYDLTHHDEVVREIHGNKTQTLKARAGTGGNNTPIVFEPGIASRDGGHVYNGTAPTLRANPGDNAPAICLNDQGGSVMDVSDKAGTLRAESHGHEPCVCIAGNIMDRQVQNGGNGVGAQENISYTLNTVDRHAVCAIGIDQQGGKGQANYAIEKCPTLASESHGTPHAVAVGYRAGQYGQYVQDDKAGSTRASGGDLGGAAKP